MLLFLLYLAALYLFCYSIVVDAKQRPRCPESFNQKHPYDEQRERDIYNMVMERAVYDPVIQNLVGNPKSMSTKGLRSLGGGGGLDDGRDVTVPIIFHIFLKNGFQQPVPIKAFKANVDVINDAYSGTGIYKGIPDTGIRFSLQAVHVIVNKKYFAQCSDEFVIIPKIKQTTAISPERYLNVYICSAGNLLGYSNFPDDDPETSKNHGIILNFRTLPSVPGYKPFKAYNQGDTLVHEAGHYFGLYHTFAGGCSTKGDGVADTPAEKKAAYGKLCQQSPPRDSCPSLPGVDPVTNFMDYTNDVCLNNFTPLQAAKIRTMLFKYRPTLTQNQPRQCVTGGNFGTFGSWKLCTSPCVTTDTPDNTQSPANGWCYTQNGNIEWGDCCCVENGCNPSDNIYGINS